MFPSNHGKNSNNNIPPMCYAEQCLLGTEQQITFSRNEPTSSFFHVSPFLDHNNRFFNYQHELLISGQPVKFPPYTSVFGSNGVTSAVDAVGANNTEMAVPGTTQNMFSSIKKSSPLAAGRKRSSNKERHSKIFTAQGLRDRRMRLSVDVARKFFGLQDMLGFDKASKTIGWLMMKSKKAIKELTKGISQRGDNSRSTESEDISGLDETAVDVNQQEKDLKKKPLEAKETVQGTKKAAVSPAVKELRVIAREKARKRTREKMSKRLEKSKELPKGSTHSPHQLSPSIPLGLAEESRSHIIHEKSFELGVEINESNKIGPSAYDDYHHHSLDIQEESTGDLVSFDNNGMMTLTENWDMGTTRTSRLSYCDAPNMHLFTGF